MIIALPAVKIVHDIERTNYLSDYDITAYSDYLEINALPAVKSIHDPEGGGDKSVVDQGRC